MALLSVHTKKIIIDDKTFKDYTLHLDNFKKIWRNKNILTISDCKNSNDINKDNVLITNNPRLIEIYKNKIKVATFNNRYKTDKNICKIEYINDLIALRYLK